MSFWRRHPEFISGSNHMLFYIQLGTVMISVPEYWPTAWYAGIFIWRSTWEVCILHTSPTPPIFPRIGVSTPIGVRAFSEDQALGVHAQSTTAAAGFLIDTLLHAIVWLGLFVKTLRRSLDWMLRFRVVPFPCRSLQNHGVFPLVVGNADWSTLDEAEYQVRPKFTESPISQYHDSLAIICNVISAHEDHIHPVPTVPS